MESETQPRVKSSVEVIDMVSLPLDAEQRQIVELADLACHVLVVAPPGSGKTLSITRRICHLLEQNLTERENILALTFTERAANELSTRLDRMVRPGVTASTFHRYCVTILREFGDEVGVRLPLRVMAEAEIRAVVRETGERLGMSRLSEIQIGRILGAVSLSKREHLEAPELAQITRFNEDISATFLADFERYQRETGGLDFDDLILKSTEMLYTNPMIAQRYHDTLRFVFVDEFQDVSIDQVQLLNMLAPPGVQGRQVIVVADQNQSIFGFRGAHAAEFLNMFRRDYHPKVIELRSNHRSVAHVVMAAKQLMERGMHLEVSRSVRPEGYLADFFLEPDEQAEANLVTQLIKRAFDHGYRPRDVAVLYRRHKRAEFVEMNLIDADIRIRRLRPGRFLDQPDAKEVTRYLELVMSLGESQFERAVNWPRVLVDELTMNALVRLARQHNVSIAEIAQQRDLLRQSLSPMSSTAISNFMDAIVAPLAADSDKDARNIVAQLLELLARRRDPIPPRHYPELEMVLKRADSGRKREFAKLRAAIAAGQSITVVSNDSVDGRMARLLIGRALKAYFDIDIDTSSDADTFEIHCGASRLRPGEQAVHIAPAERIEPTSVALASYRFFQQFLMDYETLDQESFVVVDIETTSSSTEFAEILEIGAIRIRHGKVTHETFQVFVRPSGPDAIAPGAAQVHGIRWEDVENGFAPVDALQRLFAFVDNDSVVGHNLKWFDFPVIDRVRRECGLTDPGWLLLDSCQLARRLHPDQPARLDDLVTREEKARRTTHGALIDAELAANVWLRLLEDLHNVRETGVLSECLPYVAVSLLSHGQELEPDAKLLCALGANAFRLQPLGDLLDVAENHGDVALIERLEQCTEQSDPDESSWTELKKNWTELVDRFAESGRNPSLDSFLHFVHLAAMSDLEPLDNDRVSMMTVYSAKGHEWPVVLIVGLEDGEFPFSWGSRPDEVEEGRRSLYVGMTRASERLIMTAVASFAGEQKVPSRFLEDLDGQFIDRSRRTHSDR